MKVWNFNLWHWLVPLLLISYQRSIFSHAAILKVFKCLEPNFFTCVNNHCVSSTLVCDGKNDCGDLSDERHCNHSTISACPSGEVLKADGLSCEVPTHCQVGQFRCTSGECIPIHLTCNGRADCPRGDDELHCKILTLSCPRQQFACHDGEKCLDHHQKCDGNVDCQDRSDEISCFKQSKCRSGDFQCKSGSCIPMSWRCDRTGDCDDRSDEENCETAACHPEKEFRCASGTCIPANWECDGQPDCIDASDEHGACEVFKCLEPNFFTCVNNDCVSSTLVCDGKNDCGDLSDERHCNHSTISACTSGEVLKADGLSCEVPTLFEQSTCKPGETQ